MDTTPGSWLLAPGHGLSSHRRLCSHVPKLAHLYRTVWVLSCIVFALASCQLDDSDARNAESVPSGITQIYGADLEAVVSSLSQEQMLRAAQFMDGIPELYYDSLGYYHNRLILDYARQVQRGIVDPGAELPAQMANDLAIPRELSALWSDPSSFKILEKFLSDQDLKALDSLKSRRLAEALSFQIWNRRDGRDNPAMATQAELSVLDGPLARVMYRSYVSTLYYSSHLWYPNENGLGVADVLAGTFPSSTVQSRFVGDCFSLGYAYSCCGPNPRSQCSGAGGNGGWGGTGSNGSGGGRTGWQGLCNPPAPLGYYQGNCNYPPCENCIQSTLKGDANSAAAIAVSGFVYYFIISELATGGVATVPNVGYVATVVGVGSTFAAINCNLAQNPNNPNCNW